MATPRVIRTPLDLVKWVRRVLGDKWYIDFSEKQSVYHGRNYGPCKATEFTLFVICKEPVNIHVSLSTKTFASLVKKVDEELWENIREEFEKQTVQWQCPPDPDLIETKKPRLTAKAKPLALTHKPAAAPQSKQLLLLPPPVAARRCAWPGCKTHVDAKSWSCRQHWQRLPPRLQELISMTYRPGEPDSAEYRAALIAVQNWFEKVLRDGD